MHPRVIAPAPVGGFTKENQMTIRRIILGALVALAPACDGGGDTTTRGELGTVQGRLTAADGSATSATLLAIDDDGETTAVAQGDVTADGHFRIEDVPAGAGPFLVRVEGSASVVGQVIVPGDITAGDTTTTLPIDGESTVEAQALVTLLAGDADRATIDVVGLMTWIDAGLAADVGASSSASLAAAWWSAQSGWLAVTGASASAASEARLEAFAAFAAEAHADGHATADAWHDFVAEAQADLMARLDLGADVHADAQAAAAFLFEAALSGDAALADGAARVGATLSAHASWASQVAAASGSSASAAVSARLDAAYDRFFDVIATASDRDAMAAAWVQLSGAISGQGATDGASAALELLATAEGQADTSAIEAALAATASARAELEADLDAALSGASEARASAVASAFVGFRADVEAAIGQSLAAASDRVEAFVVESATQIQGAMGVLFELDLLGELEVGLTIVGDIAASIMAEVAGATLVAIDASGAARVVAEGVVADGAYRFEGVTETGATLVVELSDAAGDIVGAARLDAIAQAEGTVEGAAITTESTVEALVFLTRVDDGERPSAIESGWLELFVDGAVAAAASSSTDGDAAIAALARATLSAQIVATSAATLAEERARAEAALAFELAIETASSVASELVAAAEARAEAEAELALDAAIAHLSTSGLASLTHVIDLAADGELVADLAATLSLDVTGEAALRAGIEQAMTAGAAFEASARAAITASASAGGDGLAAAWSQARVTFDAAVASALTLPTVSLSETDHAALVTIVTHLALGFHADVE
ncbi:MAG: hypothetical protein IT385_03225 [Deltaproteobacteria bacterium]|nr:hypothetical protein [Deltaproteobacteria bacterium]